ncbi:TetR family transcriptional regulator [Rhodobacteraceae bacterium NNCM2]|nr:TetR family transcriptional regulator [Coraliihabitans acroporae]
MPNSKPPQPSAPRSGARGGHARSKVTRKRLVEASIEALKQDGMANMTLQDIARRAGMTTGAVQYHFRSKAELLEATQVALFAGEADGYSRSREITGRAREAAGLADRCALFVEAMMVTYGQPDYFVLWEIIIGSRLDPSLDKQSVEHRQMTLETWLSQFRDCFPEIAVSDEDAMELVNFVTAHLRGISLLNRYGPVSENRWCRQTAMIGRALHEELANLPTVEESRTD